MIIYATFLIGKTENMHNKVGLKSTSAFLLDANSSVSCLAIRNSSVFSTSPGTDVVPNYRIRKVTEIEETTTEEDAVKYDYLEV